MPCVKLTRSPLLELGRVVGCQVAVGVDHLLCPCEGEVGEEGRAGQLQQTIEVCHHVDSTQVDSGPR